MKKEEDMMNLKMTLPITEARKRIFEIAENVQKPGVYYTFTEKGRPKVVVLSAGEYESWKETMEVMKIFPDLEKDIKDIQREVKKGDYITLEELFAKEGYTLSSKGGRGAISGNNTKKGSKRSRSN